MKVPREGSDKLRMCRQRWPCQGVGQCCAVEALLYHDHMATACHFFSTNVGWSDVAVAVTFSAAAPSIALVVVGFERTGVCG